MTDEQIQALEALDAAAHSRYGVLIDMKTAQLAIKASTLDELLKLGLIGTAGRGSFTVTMRGTHQAIENRIVPPTNA